MRMNSKQQFQFPNRHYSSHYENEYLYFETLIFIEITYSDSYCT